MKSLYTAYGASVRASLRDAVRLCLDSRLWYYLTAKEKQEAIYYCLKYV